MGPIGVLALQGAFREHRASLEKLGAETREIRQLKDVPGISALVIPGGESTTIGKLLTELGLLEPITTNIRQGLPVFGTCAGLILLCREIENSDQPRIGLLDAKARRNAFGRQIESFETDLACPEFGASPLPAVFIRAPVITGVGPGVDILATVPIDSIERPVAIRQGNILATAFHPELTSDLRVHDYFLQMARRQNSICRVD